MPHPPRPARPQAAASTAKAYRHAQDAVARPEAGAAPRFRSKREKAGYRYDSSLSPALDWDDRPAREVASWLLAAIEDAAALPGQSFPEVRVLRGADGKALLSMAGLQDALAALKRMQAPFLNWSGKAERLSFDVPTLPLFVHERFSTEAIIRTVEGHRKTVPQADLPGLFNDPKMPMAKQVDAYAHRGKWVNRMVLGDNLAVMNSLLRFEGLGGQVQMIYMDPPYGVKFGSNFQPFVRKRDVSHGDDEDMTREPEMVQAYRDTWELGLHSYLTYLRDRLMLAKDLLAPSGSLFLQISDDNLHHVREVMDEVFGAENCVSVITIIKTTGNESRYIPAAADFLLWYARDAERLKFRPFFGSRADDDEAAARYDQVELPDGTRRSMSSEERRDSRLLPNGARRFQLDNLVSPEFRLDTTVPFEFEGKTYHPGINNHWKTTIAGLRLLAEQGRIMSTQGGTIRYVRYFDDFPAKAIHNVWTDISGSIQSRSDPKIYTVQTSVSVVARCLLMATDPGDLVLDPTCGAGTTAYAAEQWGRRWMTVDTSRVPLALARQRLLTATFPWYRLRDEGAGPASGFIYARRQSRKGVEVGGIIPRVTLGSIANNEPAEEVVLVDRPETDDTITRVSGPFVIEAVLPTPQPFDETEPEPPQDAPGDHVARMIEVLRRSPELRLPGGASVTLKAVRRPARSLNLSAEAMVEHEPAAVPASLSAAATPAHEAHPGGSPLPQRPVAVLFGPADGAVTAKAVLDAAKEANAKNYAHLYVIGFGFTAEAQMELDAGEDALGLPASRVTMTHDVLMGDLLKTQRSSQIFAITGSPEIAVTRLPEAAEDGTPRWQVRLLGLDTFDPVTVKPHHLNGDDVPMWMLDTDWNGMAFSADQVFFPRTGAWENLKKALKSTHADGVWDHLAGDLSAPFAAPVGTEVAVKVLDDRGNELLKTSRLGG